VPRFFQLPARVRTATFICASMRFTILHQ